MTVYAFNAVTGVKKWTFVLGYRHSTEPTQVSRRRLTL